MPGCKYGREAPRERDYNCGSMFAGSLDNLIKVGPKQKQRAVVDTHGCSLTLAMNVLMFISDTVMLFHSPPGCLDDCATVGMVINKLRAIESQNPFQWEMRNIHMCTTNMNEESIIFGGEERLAKAIEEAKRRYNPRLIAVLVSCSAAIIGDDVNSVCSEYQEKFGDETYVLPFMSQGYQTHSWINYSDIIWPTLVEKIMKEPEEKNPFLVNFFRPSNTTGEDVAEIERLLGELDLTVNVLPDLQSVGMIESAPESALNTGMCCGYFMPVAKAMKKRFGTQHTETPYVLGIEFTSQWLREIGEITGKEKQAEKLIAKEKDRIMPELKALQKKLKGKRIVIAASHSKTLGLLQVCHDLEVEPIWASSHFTDDSLLEGKRLIREQLGNIEFLVGSPVYEEACKIMKNKPDVVIGHGELTNMLATLGIANKCTYLYNSQAAHSGYQGVIEIGRLTLEAIENPVRNEIVRHYRNSTGLNWNTMPFLEDDFPTRYVSNTHYEDENDGNE